MRTPIKSRLERDKRHAKITGKACQFSFLVHAGEGERDEGSKICFKFCRVTPQREKGNLKRKMGELEMNQRALVYG